MSQSWNHGFPVPGPAWEPLAGNPCLGTCSWEPLGNLFLGTLLGNQPCLGTSSWDPVPNFAPCGFGCSEGFSWKRKPFLGTRFPTLRAVRIWLPRPAPEPVLWLKTPSLRCWGKRFGKAAFQELLVPKPQSYMFPVLGTSGSQTLAPMLPNLGTTGSQFEDCWIPKIGTHASQSWNHLFPVLGTTVFQTLEPMLPNLGTVRFRFKKLPVPKEWNQFFPSLEL